MAHHSSFQQNSKYLPLLRNAATNGDLPQTALALTEDRYLMNHEKEQIYGSQATIFNGENIIWPIKNPEKVNELRKKIGFTQTVEEYSKSLFGKDFQYKAYTLEEIKKSSKTTE